MNNKIENDTANPPEVKSAEFQPKTFFEFIGYYGTGTVIFLWAFLKQFLIYAIPFVIFFKLTEHTIDVLKSWGWW